MRVVGKRRLTCIECDEPAEFHWLCAAHYEQMKRPGAPTLNYIQRRDTLGLCIAPDCSRRATAGRLCLSHYSEAQTRDLFVVPELDACAVDGCDRPATSTGECRLHRQRTPID